MQGYAPRLAPLVAAALLCAAGVAQAQSFSSQNVLLPVTYPTSLQFGPDGRLYVSEQFGTVHAFTIERGSDGVYRHTAQETIGTIQAIANHNDDGSACSEQCDQRQVTGLLVAGSAAAPVLYVSSSDPRVAVASDSGLDTNSGLVTRLTCSGGLQAGQCQAWTRVDIVRGLPRSEENHATNGMALDVASNMLYLAVGGNTNKGAISNSFSGTGEYFLSGAILSIDLDAIAALETAHGGAFTDPRSGTRFVYDLPTLDDPSRPNLTKNQAGFPYPAGHPWRELSVDAGDPFGGNDGFNQALPEPGGPVQVHSPGYRNPYDVLVTEAGTVWTWDNGANSGWGGTPLIRASDGTLKGWSTQPGVTLDAGAGDYCTNELNESGSSTVGDALHLIPAAGYYGGHAAPIRGTPLRSGLYNYVQEASGHWTQTGPVRQLGELLPAGFGLDAGDFPDDPRQCEFTAPATGLEIVDASTNGLAEYRADNFGGTLRGDLLVASFNGNLYRCKPDGAGGLVDLPGSAAGTTLGRCEVLLGGFGSQPLDVTAQPEGAIFPGTIWAATYGASSIVVFEPSDFACDPTDPAGDADTDGYRNGDEAANGTNPCSAGSQPDDADDDLISDLGDPDDDNDSRLDVDDVFALDAGNGTTTALPLHLPLFNNDPGRGLFGLGFTGLMLPRDGSTDWRDGYDPAQLAAGGTAGLLTVEAVDAGTARGASRNQRHGFQFGFDAHAGTPPFAVSTRLRAPWFEVGGAAGAPLPGQAYGLFLGRGDQDDYLSIALAGGAGGTAEIEVVREVGGSASATRYTAAAWAGQNLLAASALELAFVLDPQAATAQPRLSLDGGASWHALGSPLALPPSWLSAVDASGLAAGAFATAGDSGATFGATWDRFDVDFVAGSTPGAWSQVADYEQMRHENGFVQAGADFYLIGGRESDQVQRWSPASGTWTPRATAPLKLHHFQAVELDGLIYVVGAMTGDCCSEPPATHVYIYDPLADRWTLGPAIPVERRRGGGAAVVHGGRIYWISGNTRGHEGPLSAAVDVFDPRTGRFTARAPIPHPRDHFFAAEHAGRIYAVGGRRSDAAADGDVFDDVVAEVDVYDIAADSWTTLPAASNLPVPRAGAPTAKVGAELVVAGGESAGQSGAHAETHAFDFASARWRSVASMLTPRHATQAIASNGGFYVAAGSPLRGGPDRALDLEVLHLYAANPPGGDPITAGQAACPSGLDFGRIGSGGTAARTLRIEHDGGNQAVIVEALTLQGDDAFRVAGGPSLPFVLAAGETIELPLEFEPLAQGPATATLTVSSPGGGSCQTALEGEGYGSADGAVLYRINVGGPELAALDAPNPAWSADDAATPSPYRVAGGAERFDDGQSGAYPGPIDMDDPSLPNGVPPALFRSERWDPGSAPEMRWELPVPAGTEVEVRLYFAELYSGIETVGERVFAVEAEGQVPPEFETIDRFGQAGAKGAIMRSALVSVQDGSLSLEFRHLLENPALNGIEVRSAEVDNLAPVARDDYASVAPSGTVMLDLLGNDSDPDGSLQPGSMTLVEAPHAGVLEAVGSTWRYVHGGAAGSGDRFTYTVRDQEGAVSAPATVRLRVDLAALPADADGDGLANASDADDDNDGLPDTTDPFALDAANGRATPLPRRLAFLPGAPGGGLFGLGFTGVLSNGSDYASLFDPGRVFLDDRAEADAGLTLAAVDEGDAEGGTNSQRNGFQFGIDARADSGVLVAQAELVAPFFDGAGLAGASQGLVIGRGDQQNYVEFALAGDGSLRLVREEGGATSVQTLALPGALQSSRLTLLLAIEPASAQARAMVSLDGGAPVALGAPLPLPAAWLAPGPGPGLAVGIVATSAGPGAPYAAHWRGLAAARLAEDDVYELRFADGAVLLDVLGNDGDAAGRVLVSVGTPDAGGSATIDDGGTPNDPRDDRIRYTPGNGPDETFDYTVGTAFGWNASGVVLAIDGGMPRIFASGFEGSP
jgi:hypothetical protein